jgi:sugar (pentulose or hexulose) kinase
MLKNRESETFAKAKYFYTTEESVTGFLCGNFVTDPTGQVLTRLYDRRNSRYLPEALALLGIDESMLAEVVPCGSEAGRLLPEVAESMGIPAGIPVYVGAHDQYCASIGSGVSKPGELLIATGTAWVVFGVSDKIIDTHPYPAWCNHPIEGIYGIMLSLAGCGGALGHFASANNMKVYELDRGILAAGLRDMRERIADYFVCPLPPLSPIPHRDGVGGDITARDGHDVFETALAAMEGAAFEARILIEEFAKAGFPDSGEIVISGGASKSQLWVDILAAVFPNRPLYRLCEPDAPALGAALLAATSNGAYSTFANASAAFTERVLVEVDSEAAEFYNEKYNNYRKYALAD